MQTKHYKWYVCVFFGVEHVERPKETEAGLSSSCHIPHILTSSICNTHTHTYRDKHWIIMRPGIVTKIKHTLTGHYQPRKLFAHFPI